VQTRAILDAGARSSAERGFTLWWWRERSSGALVGQVGLSATDVDGEPVVEVGWSMSPERWGEGFATEAATASLEFGFDRIGLARIVSFTMVENHASQAVMKRIGLTYVGDFARDGLPHVLYDIRAPA
jgi:RimJ/RimL family protein N-acetyltransferase